MSADRRWNHNIHYHPVVLGAVPEWARRALDVGCGDGPLARELRAVLPQVTGIDRDPASIDRARVQDDPAQPVDYLLGDFLDYSFEPASFDLVASVAALHHMPAGASLERMRGLLRPGGRLVVIGLARASLSDLPIEVAAVAVNAIYRLTKTYWAQQSPTVWPPPETFAGMRRLAAEHLPGVRYRRHLLWRYSLTWTQPAPEAG